MIIIEEYPPFAVDVEGSVYNTNTNNKLNPHIDAYGYLRASTTSGGEKCNALVHRLLAIAFIPNLDGLPQVNHKDGIKTNNTLSNLEWCTNQDNSDHANRSGLRDSMLGEGSHFNVHTESTVKLICELLQEGSRNVDISRVLKVPICLVSDVRAGRSWTQVSKNYRIDRNKRVSYSEDKVRFICNLLQCKTPYKSIALQAEVPLHTVRDIKGKKSFKHISELP